MAHSPSVGVRFSLSLRADPYFMKNHLGSYECKLCLTLHTNEGSYLAHTQGKKHQQNLARRAAKLQKDRVAQPAEATKRVPTRRIIKIGRPGYKVRRTYDRVAEESQSCWCCLRVNVAIRIADDVSPSLYLSSPPSDRKAA